MERSSWHRLRTCGRSRRPSMQDDVGARGVHEGRGLGGHDPHLVQQQAEGGQHLRRRLEGVGQQQQRAHAVSLCRSSCTSGPNSVIAGGLRHTG